MLQVAKQELPVVIKKQELPVLTYPYGKSILQCSIEDCPIEVFHPESNFYKSCIENIEKFKQNIQQCEKKLKIIENQDVYVEQQLPQRREEYKSKILEEIEDLRSQLPEDFDESVDLPSEDEASAYFDKESQKIPPDQITDYITFYRPYFIEIQIRQLQQKLENIDEIITPQIIREYEKTNHLSKEMIPYITEEMITVQKHLDCSETQLETFKKMSLEHAKEKEKKMMELILSLPHSIKDIEFHIKEFVIERVSYEQSELLEFYKFLVHKVVDGENKFQEEIETLLAKPSANKVYEIFPVINDNCVQSLLKMTNKFLSAITTPLSDSELFSIEDYMRKKFDKFITMHYSELTFKIIQKQIEYAAGVSLSKSTPPSTPQIAKSITTALLKVVNKNIGIAMQQKVEENLKNFILNIIDELQMSPPSDTKQITSQVSQPQIIIEEEEDIIDDTYSDDPFLSQIRQAREYTLDELTDIYNQTFNTSYSANRVSKMKIIKNNFKIARPRLNGTRKRIYTLL